MTVKNAKKNGQANILNEKLNFPEREISCPRILNEKLNFVLLSWLWHLPPLRPLHLLRHHRPTSSSSSSSSSATSSDSNCKKDTFFFTRLGSFTRVSSSIRNGSFFSPWLHKFCFLKQINKYVAVWWWFYRVCTRIVYQNSPNRSRKNKSKYLGCGG